MHILRILTIAVVLLAGLPGATAAEPDIELELLVDGLSSPVGLSHAGDGSGRLFVVERSGRIKIIRDGQVLATPFLDIRGRVKAGGEEGLLSVAFAPGYAENGRFYVYYTDLDGNVRISRFQVSANADIADPQSEAQVLVIDHPEFENHNGGQLAFGPQDGYLYIGTGDGGGAGDAAGRIKPANNAQNLESLLGKILRIDVEAVTGPGYAIPADNPLVGQPGRDEIWAAGLRNPWRFAFDRDSGELYIGDVGQGAWEEINVAAAGSGGQNYGWNIMEGEACYNAQTCNQTGLTLPVAVYNHDAGNCSVTGGYVYRGSVFANLVGMYFYADYCTGRLWSLRMANGSAQEQQLRLDTSANIASFGEDEAGELYVVDLSGGSIARIVDVSAAPAPPSPTPETVTATPTATVTATPVAAPPAAPPRTLYLPMVRLNS